MIPHINSYETMKTQTKLALAAILLTTTVAAHADWVNGYYRGSGTYVAPHYRTSANGSVYDNLSYRGYPSQQPGYLAPHSYGSTRVVPYSFSGTSTSYGNTTYHNYRSSYGGSLSGKTTTFGNTSFTTLQGR